MLSGLPYIIFSSLEYIPLRLIRRFIFSNRMVSYFNKYLPYYETSLGETSPESIVSLYRNHISNKDLNEKSILEIGTGKTNATGYEIVAQTDCTYMGYEPFAAFDAGLDRRSLYRTCRNHNRESFHITSKVIRINKLEDLPDSSADIILSHSVLEHVNDPEQLFSELKRILKSNGFMLHIVDYRDHFFKYPYHFLLFSPACWNNYLNPGDLPRYRLGNHIRCFSKLGFRVTPIDTLSDTREFTRIKNWVNPYFRAVNDDTLAVTSAILHVTHELNERD